MTESLTTSTLFNSFKVFREILMSISALSTLNDKWGKSAYYFEDFPSLKASNFVGFPLITIETEMDQESLTIKEKKQMKYTTTVTIYIDYFVEKDKILLNSYMNTIPHWFNTNKNTLRWTYGLWGTSEISKDRELDVIGQKRIVKGILTFNYHITLDTSS